MKRVIDIGTNSIHAGIGEIEAEFFYKIVDPNRNGQLEDWLPHQLSHERWALEITII